MKHSLLGVLMISCITAAIAPPAYAAPDGQWGPDFSVEGGRLRVPGVGADNPVIYDNDWWLDIIDASYCLARHKLGQLDLRGLIVTRDMWPSPPGYTLEDSVRDFRQFRQLALASGLTTAPDFVSGAKSPLRRPESGRISDTEFTVTPGSELIVAEARKASRERPLIVVVGGAPTTVATALLQEPEIAHRLVVLWLAIREYNAKDEWGSHVMLMRSPVIHYHFQIRNGLTRAMLQSLPSNPLSDRLKQSELVYDNGVGDGVLLAWLHDPSLITGAEKQNVRGLIGFTRTEEEPYGFLHIPDQHKRPEAIAQLMIDVLREPAVWDPAWVPPFRRETKPRQ
jgi:hypothetical protein